METFSIIASQAGNIATTLLSLSLIANQKMQTKQSLGQRIKRFRMVNDIRQEDMAEKMGVSRATLINYEKATLQLILMFWRD